MRIHDADIAGPHETVWSKGFFVLFRLPVVSGHHLRALDTDLAWLVNAQGESTFVKFHWRSKYGAASVVWDEAVKINGADPDFHRRDLYESIAKGVFPEWEFGIQAFDQATADGLDFDVLDATKVIPEEIVPIQFVGRMVLDRNPVNFFAETEQVAFCPTHIVPGIDFTNDPLLQGRLFSYLDTQISRLGGANFHELPINRPRCPMRNLQRDGQRRMDVAQGRVSYEPNSLDPNGPREDHERGFRTFAPQEGVNETGGKLRIRPDSFADHYSQARQFYRSMSAPEQRHIQQAFSFEFAKIEAEAVRNRMLGHLHLVDESLAHAVEANLGVEGKATKIKPFREPIELAQSPALSMLKTFKPMLLGRKVGVIVSDGFDSDKLQALRAAVEDAGGEVAVIGPKIGEVKSKKGPALKPDMALSGAPSVFFDAVALLAPAEGIAMLVKNAAAVDWLRDAYGHLKVIGCLAETDPLFAKAGLTDEKNGDEGIIRLDSRNGTAAFVEAAKNARVWAREERM